MDPITAITLATKMAETTGLSQWLGRKLGGDKGAEVAQKVSDIAQTVTGAKTPDEALQKIQLDSVMRENLKQRLIDQSHEIEKAEFADIANARHMQEVALAQADVFAKRFVYYFAAFWSLFAVIYIMSITFGKVPEANQRFADTILGFLLGTIVATIINFFYGTSRSSQGKDSTLQHALDALKGYVKR